MTKFVGIIAIAVMALTGGDTANARSEKKQACLEQCRTKMRAIPGFFQNRANARYCKDKCGVR